MGFWVFMFCVNLLIPVCMIAFGRYFGHHTPKEINYLFGYRTTMSMKNEDTWQFANRYMGKLWWKLGWILLVVSIVLSLLLLGRDDDIIATYASVISIAQIVPMLASIIPVEKALRNTFDRDGNRKQ